jgi:hypothetical protein
MLAWPSAQMLSHTQNRFCALLTYYEPGLKFHHPGTKTAHRGIKLTTWEQNLFREKPSSGLGTRLKWSDIAQLRSCKIFRILSVIGPGIQPADPSAPAFPMSGANLSNFSPIFFFYFFSSLTAAHNWQPSAVLGYHRRNNSAPPTACHGGTPSTSHVCPYS